MSLTELIREIAVEGEVHLEAALREKDRDLPSRLSRFYSNQHFLMLRKAAIADSLLVLQPHPKCSCALTSASVKNVLIDSQHDIAPPEYLFTIMNHLETIGAVIDEKELLVARPACRWGWSHGSIAHAKEAAFAVAEDLNRPIFAREEAAEHLRDHLDDRVRRWCSENRIWPLELVRPFIQTQNSAYYFQSDVRRLNEIIFPSKTELIESLWHHRPDKRRKLLAEIRQKATKQQLQLVKKHIKKDRKLTFTGDEFRNVLCAPGVYMFEKDGKPLYIGKGKNVFSRSTTDQHHRADVREQADTVSIHLCDSEESALALEAGLIAELRPSCNHA